MSTSRRVTKNTTGRVPKPPAKPRKKAVSAIQARRLAARHVMARMFDNVPVCDGAEMKGGVYRLRRDDVWMVFPNSEAESISIHPSLVVAVCKRTGRVLYSGPANDEG